MPHHALEGKPRCVPAAGGVVARDTEVPVQAKGRGPRSGRSKGPKDRGSPWGRLQRKASSYEANSWAASPLTRHLREAGHGEALSTCPCKPASPPGCLSGRGTPVTCSAKPEPGSQAPLASAPTGCCRGRWPYQGHCPVPPRKADGAARPGEVFAASLGLAHPACLLRCRGWLLHS